MHARRVSATPQPGGSPFLGSRSPVQPSCEAIRRCRAGISPSADGGSTALPRGAKRIDNLRFSILLGLQLSLLGGLGGDYIGEMQKGTVSVCAARRGAQCAPIPRRGRGRLHGFCVPMVCKVQGRRNSDRPNRLAWQLDCLPENKNKRKRSR